jgi:hypothetical protein
MDGLILGRIGHYCTPRMGREAFACQAGIVTHVKGEEVNLRVYDADGDPFVRLDVLASLTPDGEKATFHYTHDCPFGR